MSVLERKYNLKGGRAISSPDPREEVVISGFAGEFPGSSNVHELLDNLHKKVDMTKRPLRWDYCHPDIPPTGGNMKTDLTRFDAGFFGWHDRLANNSDGLLRLAVEKAVEAVMDAGLHPEDLQNQRCGVFVGACFSESESDAYYVNIQPEFPLIGYMRNQIAHRIGYYFKLKGPAFALDTACSSSSNVFENAFNAIRSGVVDSAIVAGVNININPRVTLQFSWMGPLSKDATCRPFDKNNNGYVRSETASALLLQKYGNAKRVYGHVIYSKANSDGHKEQGITYPSMESQKLLLEEFYEDCGLPVDKLGYMEAHGTGTAIGDPVECGAIDEAISKHRKKPLLIGSVKSNIGHAEGSSGMGALAKVILALETGVIPPNINFTEPNPKIPALVEGRLQVVAEPKPLPTDYVCVSSFGFGGSNCHILLKRNPKTKINGGIPADNIPRLVCVSGRETSGVNELLQLYRDSKLDVEYVRLLHDIFRKNIQGHLYRGYSITTKSGEVCRQLGYLKKHTSLYFAFGELANWYGISTKLMQLPPFADSMQRSQKHLSKKINLSDFSDVSKSHQYQVIGNIAVQIGIIDLFNAIKLKPKKNYGHGYGELLALYAEGKIIREQVLDCAVSLNNVLNSHEILSNNSEKPPMTNGATNGNSYYKTNAERLDAALRNNKVLRNRLVEDFCLTISLKNTIVDKLIESITTSLNTRTQEMQPDDVLVSLGWLPSTCIPDDVKLYAYNPTSSLNIVNDLLKLLGNIYIAGYNTKLDELYPSVEYPVSRNTRMISPYIKWKHDRIYYVQHHSNASNSGVRGIRHVTIGVHDLAWSYVAGHVIDGRNLFPATGYLFLAWQTLAVMNNTEIFMMDVIFQDCRFHRATSLPSKGEISFSISVHGSGRFEVLEGNVAVVTGTILLQDNEKPPIQHSDFEVKNAMKLHDVYKELKLRGYNYTGGFRHIQDYDLKDYKGHIKWDDNWVTFMDNMLQMKILAADTRLLYVPTYIQEVRLYAKSHIEWISNNYGSHKLETNLPAYYNNHSNTISCGYIKIQGLMSSAITRKKDMRVPVLEKYIFVPNETFLTVEESVRVNIQIILENCLVPKVKSVEIVDEFTSTNSNPLSPIMLSVLEDQPMIQPNITILSKTPTERVNITTVDKELNTETDCTLIVASKLSQRPELLVDICVSLKENGFIIDREESNYNVSKAPFETLDICTVHRTKEELLVLYRRKLPQKPMSIMKIGNHESFSWIEELQKLQKSKGKEDIVLYSEKDSISGILGLTNCLRREPETRNIRCVFLMDESDTFAIDDVDLQKELNKNLAINVRKGGRWGTYRHMLIKRERYVEAEHVMANTMVRGDLSSLRWTEGPLSSSILPPLERNLVYIYYSSLNFKDVMIASGKLSIDIVKSRVDQDCLLGIEYSGIDYRGNRVMGLAPAGAISTMILSDTYFQWKVPDYLSLEEAATVTTVYGTLAYGLLYKGKLKRGDSILIHSGTGGIGLAAIRMAIHYGVTIFVTVGTKEKKEYLLKTFPQIKASNIGNSRDTSFEQMIMKQTEGKGVDLVLNSLAEEKLIASVRCLANGGRFIEIGKFDLTKNSELRLMLLEKGASFIAVALDLIMWATPNERKIVIELLDQLLDEKVIRPLDRTVFKMTEVEQAFRYMTTGRHIGKVLLQIRDSESNAIVEKKKYTSLTRYNCYGDKCYIILGGLGGFGLELADWMIIRGCRKLVLTSRKGVTTGYQAYRMKTWKSYGVDIHVSTANVTTKEGCRELIKEAQKMGPIQAVYNLAVILQDAVFENQTAETFSTAFGPKARATKYLDEVTREMCPNLEEFVIFSSVSCGRGNAGQTNYGMANSIMERICEKRREDGYPGLAIEWGAIGEVGLVAEMQTEQHEIEIGGTLQQRISSCMDTLNILLRQDEAPVVSSTVVAEKRGVGDATSVIDVVLFILGVEDVKSVSLHSTLPELGMDSMTSVEIKQTLEREFEIFLSPKDIRSLTLARLKEIEMEKYETDSPNKSTAIATSQETYGTLGLDQVLRILGGVEESKKKVLRLESRLQEGHSGPTVFFLPGTEGFAKVMQNLASWLFAHVIALQYTHDMEFETIQDIAKGLVPAITQHLKTDEPFRIVAYSLGTVIGVELCSILESMGYRGILICLDGTPLIVKNFIQRLISATSEEEFQTGLCLYMLNFVLPSHVVKEHQEKFEKCTSWDEKSSILVQLSKDVVPFDPQYLKNYANIVLKRLKAVMNYTASKVELQCQVQLFIASRGIKTAFQDETVPEDCGLSEYCESPVTVDVFDGSHLDIVDDQQIAKKINSIVTQ